MRHRENYAAMKTLKTPTSSFVEMGYYERLLRLQATNPKAFDCLSPVERMTLQYYVEAKIKHQEAMKEELK